MLKKIRLTCLKLICFHDCENKLLFEALIWIDRSEIFKRIFLYINFPIRSKWDNMPWRLSKYCWHCEHNNIKLSDRSYAWTNAFNSWRQYSSSIVGNIDLKEWTRCWYKVLFPYKRNFLLHDDNNITRGILYVSRCNKFFTKVITRNLMKFKISSIYVFTKIISI